MSYEEFKNNCGRVRTDENKLFCMDRFRKKSEPMHLFVVKTD